MQPWELVLIQEAAGKAALADLTARAVIEQFKDAKFLDDNSRWMRITETEWHELGDGVLLADHVTLPKPLQDAPEKLLQELLKNAKSFTLLGHLGAGKIPAKETGSAGTRGTAADAGYDELQEIPPRRGRHPMDVVEYGDVNSEYPSRCDSVGHRCPICQCPFGASSRS